MVVEKRVAAVLLVLAGAAASCQAGGCHQRAEVSAPAADSPPLVRAAGAGAVDAEIEPGRASLEVRRLEGFELEAELVTLSGRGGDRHAAVVMLPADYRRRPLARYPLLVAFGGAGESAREPEEGARAWVDFYDADEAALALRRGRLDADDFRGLASAATVEAFNDRLERRGYRGLIVLCPWAPLLSADTPIDDPDYERSVMDELVPAVVERYRVEPDAIGVDGVSMGGARAMYFGLKHAGRFRTIGAIQGAFGRHLALYERLIEQHRGVLERRSIQLVTSDGDGLRPAVRAMSALLEQQGIEHRFRLLEGPHDYIFNRGPGSIAMLLFHDGALRE